MWRRQRALDPARGRGEGRAQKPQGNSRRLALQDWPVGGAAGQARGCEQASWCACAATPCSSRLCVGRHRPAPCAGEAGKARLASGWATHVASDHGHPLAAKEDAWCTPPLPWCSSGIARARAARAEPLGTLARRWVVLCRAIQPFRAVQFAVASAFPRAWSGACAQGREEHLTPGVDATLAELTLLVLAAWTTSRRTCTTKRAALSRHSGCWRR